MNNDMCQAASHLPAAAAQSARSRARACAIVALCFGTSVFAQPVVHAPIPARSLVTAQVDSGQHVILAGHRPSWAGAQNDRGMVRGDLQLQNLTLTLNRSPEREQAFQQLLKDQQNPASADFHHWLTPTELGERFGASQHDLDAISSWLAAQGLHVDAIANSRTRLSFSGSTASIASAFATPLHYYAVAGETRIANVDDPQIPAALAPVVLSVAGLHTVKYRPAHRMTQPQQRTTGSTLQPQASNCSGGSCDYFVFPADFTKIYDLPAAYNGSGQSIAIVSRARVYDTDDTNFMSLSGVTFAAPTVIVPPNGTDPGPAATTCTTTGTTDTCDKPSDAVNDQGEATLDVQRAGSVAPGATLKLIASQDPSPTSDGIVVGIEYAIDTDPVPAPILSVSFASCESDNGRSPSVAFDQIFQQAAAEGISVFVASGDGGVAGCEPLDSTPSTTQTVSTNTLCASGYVTCVGGTEFADTANPTAYWSSTNTATFRSALGYIPEGAWNDPIDDKGNTQFSSTGGGVSAYIATPSWQTGNGVPGVQGRYSPDMSFAASQREGYFTCIAAQGAGCATSSGGGFTFLGSGGTSASTPSMAGVTALLNQKIGAAQGNLNPRLYALAANAANGVFHDITVTSSGVSDCNAAVPSICNNATPGPTGLSGGLQGFLVGTGYDLATGLGSIDIANLLSQWNNTTPSVFNLDQHGLTGAWYNPATGGQGLLIETYKDLVGAGQGYLTAGWYTFDVSAAGGQRWYTLQGSANTGDSASALGIYASTGGNFNAAPKIGAVKIGTASLSFSDCATGSLSYNFDDGRSGTIPLTRVDPNITCSPAGDNGNVTQNYLLSGAWYDPSTSGQGFFFDINPAINLLFAGWYTYAPNGAGIGGGASQRWYTIQDNAFAAGTTSKSNLAVYEITGGVFNSGKVSAGLPVGTVSLTINSCTSLTVSYSFTSGTNSGQSGTINLARVVGAPAGCTTF